MLTKEQIERYTARLKECQRDTDTETAHANADDVLTDILWDLGLGDIVNQYDAVKKWYS